MEAVWRALNDAGVRYLVAGGVAVYAHGYARLTKDLDLVVQLDSSNINRAFAALAGLGYQPTVPVTAEAFADAASRRRWIDEKGMRVLNFYSDLHRDTPVDVLVEEPFHFDVEYEEAMVARLSPHMPIRFVSLKTLVEMKLAANRQQDLIDVEHLRRLLEDRAP